MEKIVWTKSLRNFLLIKTYLTILINQLIYYSSFLFYFLIFKIECNINKAKNINNKIYFFNSEWNEKCKKPRSQTHKTRYTE